MKLGETKSFQFGGEKGEKKQISDHFQMLVVLMITKDKGNCRLAGMTWLFIDKLAHLPLKKEIIKMVTEEKKNLLLVHDLVLVP